MQSDDQAFLNQIEQNIKSKDNEQDVAKREAEQRAHEMERIRKASVQAPGSKGSTSSSAPAPGKPNELENDPRYREYFQRLRKQKGESMPDAETAPAGASAPAKAQQRTGGQSIKPGAIVRFDDGSIGIYKDAVSGRDYALFYFLHPEGQFDPEGVFLQCYQAKVIGTLPENHFSQLRDSNTWDRDMIVFHLSDYEHVEFLNSISEHEERKPKPGTPAKPGSVTTVGTSTPPAGQPAQPQAQQQTPATEAKAEPPQTPEPKPSMPQTTEQKNEAPAKEPEGLVKGRRFQIKFGGKQWEAVYWTDDPEGSVVAHSTHGHWSLMRLDLERFKDSLELGDIVDAETLENIARDSAKEK